MSLNFLTSGLVQLNNPSTTINGIVNAAQNTSSTSTTTAQPDCNIYPVGNTITPNDVVYHDQTILMVNSTVNQNSNTVTAQYFDPVSGTPGGFSSWNYDYCASSYLSGTMASSALLPSSAYDDELSLFSNMQPNGTLNGGTGKHYLDITNGTSHPSPNTSAGLYFSLTSQPYYTYQGTAYGGVSNSGIVTPSNVAPGFTGNYNSYNFLFTSNYYIQQKNEIILVELLFTVSNSDATNYDAATTQGSPTLSVIIKNKILTQNALASLSTDSTDTTKVKVYTAGPIPIQYMLSGSSWNSKNFFYSIQNNVPLIIAPGYTKLYATLPVAYIPAAGGGNGYYLQQTPSPSYASGYEIKTNGGTNTVPVFNLVNGQTYTSQPPSSLGTVSGGISYGHFVVGTAYSYDYNNYTNYTNITAEVLIKNLWKSPITIYNNYQHFSVNDMATKQVVLLFGKNLTGGTFLVLNTGTPLAAITSYAVTSLRNFVSIMRAIINLFDGSTSIVDYFINPTTIAQVNQSGSYNVNVLVLQPLLEGAIQNPPSIVNCPGMWYLMLNSKNSFNFAIDPSEQSVFGQQIGFNYLGIQNSILCSTGNCVYMQSSLNMLADDLQGDLFGNSLSLGLNVIGSQSYYIVIILPEAQFNPNINTALPNTLTVYSTLNTLFYVMVTANTGSQFAPASGNYVAVSTKSSSGSTSSSSTTSLQPTYSIQKVLLSASNNPLF
jgi:hypothetical protein